MAKTDDININNVSRISAGTACRGEIYSQFDFRIDGSFEGKLHSKGRIVVGESAVVSGEIVCDNVDLWGRFSGSLYVKDTLIMKAGCRVDGEINVNRFMVELGSEFNGACKMITEDDYSKLVARIDAAEKAHEDTQKAQQIGNKEQSPAKQSGEKK